MTPLSQADEPAQIWPAQVWPAQIWPAHIWPAQIWYVELRGQDAAARLRDLLAQLPAQPGFLGAELQTSAAQPGLALLASRWAAAVPVSEAGPLHLPGGAKHWTFQVQEARAAATPGATSAISQQGGGEAVE